MTQPARGTPRGKKGKPLRDYLRAVKPTDAELRLILKNASEEAERLILRGLADTGGQGNIRTAQLRVILQQLRSQQDRMWANLEEVIRDGMSEVATTAYVEAEDLLVRYLSSVGQGEAVRAALVVQARQGLRNILAKAANDIPLSSQVYKTKALATGIVTKAIQNGLLLQKSAKAIARDVRSMINPSTPGGVSYAAFRLARTELNNAFKTSQEQRYDGEPWVKGMRWNLSGSHPVRDICNEHAEEDRHGLGPGLYPVGQRPHSHPNCLCYLTPDQIEEDEFINNLLSGEYNEFLDAKFGPTIA